MPSKIYEVIDLTNEYGGDTAYAVSHIYDRDWETSVCS